MKYHKCPKCQESYPLTEEFFYHNKFSKNGFSHSCKICDRKYYKEHKTKPNPPPLQEPPLTNFEIACLNRKLKQKKDNFSIYQEISPKGVINEQIRFEMYQMR